MSNPWPWCVRRHCVVVLKTEVLEDRCLTFSPDSGSEDHIGSDKRLVVDRWLEVYTHGYWSGRRTSENPRHTSLTQVSKGRTKSLVDFLCP